MTFLGQNPSVLLVDDDSNVRNILKAILTKMDYNTVEAENAEEAFKKLEIMDVDLIVLDLILPDMSGFEICEKIKMRDNIKAIPVIFLTSISDIENKTKGFELGAVDYLSKPIDPQEVKIRIKSHLKIYKLQKHLAAEIEFSEQLRERLEEQNQELVKQNKELAKHNNVLRNLTDVDDITQTANRHRLDEYLEQQWSVMARENKPMGILMLSIDHFKDYLFTHGHQFSDICLRKVAQRIKSQLKRASDIVGRYQKEILMVILPNTPYQGVMHIAVDIKLAIKALEIPYNETEGETVSLSVGVCSTVPHPKDTLDNLIKAAYKGLQSAKADGGNSVVYKEYDDF